MFPYYDDERLEDWLREYGLGRSVKRLSKHPKETPENRDKAARLISTDRTVLAWRARSRAASIEPHAA